MHDDAVELSFDCLLCAVESGWRFGVLQWSSEQTVNGENDHIVLAIQTLIFFFHRNIQKVSGSCSTRAGSNSWGEILTKLWCGTKSRGDLNRTGCNSITFAFGKFYGSTAWSLIGGRRFCSRVISSSIASGRGELLSWYDWFIFD